MKPFKFLLLALALLLPAPAAWAQTIPNPSFEADHYSVSPGYASGNGGVITGWTLSPGNRIGLNLGGTNTPGLFVDNGAIPDGTNVAFIQSNGTTNSIATTISGLLPGAQYQVTFRANCRAGYSQPGATWSLNGGPFVPFTCFPAVGGANPYYTNSGTFTATNITAPLVVQNWVTNTHDGTVLLDAFSAKILPQTLIHYRVISTDAATVAAGTIPSLGTLGNGTGSGTGVTLTNDVPADGVPPEAGDRAIVCNGSGGILAPDTEQLNRTNIVNAGGFTYEAWFKWNGAGNINAIIDYAGTEKLIRHATDPGPAMETDNSTISQIGAASSNQWHYVAVVFTVTSSNLASDSVTGNYTFYLDTNTPTTTVPGITINNFGDTLHQTIGVGTHPAGFASDYFNGLIFEPRVSLGALTGSNLLFKSTYVVTSTNDDGSPGTLRYAVANAATTPIIHFAPALSGQTISLSGTITLTNKVVIDASALTNGLILQGNQNRIFQTSGGSTNTLKALTITGGSTSDTSVGGGAILNGGSLTLTGCTLYGNITAAGFFDPSGGPGGAISTSGTLNLMNCTLALNSAGGGGAIYNSGTLALTQCTVSSNSSIGSGGGIFNGTGGTMTLDNTIIAGNSATSGTGLDISGLNSTNHFLDANIIQSFDSYGSTNNGTTATNVAPLLAPLGNYGGPTPTMPPLPGSPAIDAGSDAAASNFSKDQRGYPRVAGAHVDIGAVEIQYGLVVSNTTDASENSLRAAVDYGPPGSTITFAPALSGQTILLTNGQIELGTNVTIDGSALANAIQINGNGQSRIFQVDNGAMVTLNALTITNGNGNGDGGGIYNGGTLTLNNCTVIGNQANSAIYGGGGIANGGTLALNNCTITGNQAHGPLAGGGGIFDPGTLTVNNCTLTGNDASPSDLGGGGILILYGTLNLTNSIVCNNTAGDGSNIRNYAGDYNFANALVDTDALLAPPGNYGGPTPTMPPLPGSLAIDAGAATTLTTDQRGYPRVAGPHVDIGAVEVQTASANNRPVLKSSALSGGGGGGSAFHFTFTNAPGIDFTVLTATNVTLSLANWTVLGEAMQPASGQYQFTDPQAATNKVRFYRVVSP